MTKTTRRAAGALAAATVIVVCAAVARRIDRLPQGLQASYYSTSDWTPPLVRTAVDRPVGGAIAAAWNGRPPEICSAAWIGSFFVLRPGVYTIVASTSHRSWVYVDGAFVAEPVRLDRGVHQIFVRYAQDRGAPDLALSWSRDGRPLEEMPASAMAPRRASAARFLASITLRRSLAPLTWLWIAAAVAAAVSAGAPFVSRRRAPGVAAIDLAWLGAALIVLWFATPFGIESDGFIRFRALSGLLSSGELSGAPYSLIGPLASAPLWWMGRLAGSSEAWCARFNFILFAACLAGFYRAMTPELDRSTVVRFLLLLTTASMFPHHDSRFFGEVFTSLLVGIGLVVVAIKQKAWGWALAAIGAANTPASLAGLALVCAVFAMRRRQVLLLTPVAAGIALVLLESWIRRGSPFMSGYEGHGGAPTILPFSGRPGFSYPLVFGLVSILFSFGKGIAWFAPGLAVGAARDRGAHRRDAELVGSWLLFLTGLVLVYAKWWGWNGGDFWGPRFFLFASLPASYFLAERLRGPRRSHLVETLTIGCVAWSLWVGANGLLYGFNQPAICNENHYAMEFLCWYTPEYSTLFWPLVTPKRLSAPETVLAAFFVACGVYLIVDRLRYIRVRSAVSVAQSVS